MSTILIVDDDREMGRLMKTLFELEGYQVTVVREFKDILPTIFEAPPDVMLLDVWVQNQETIGLVGQIRQDEAFASIPIVMSSGMDRRRECLAVGADLFVLKPFLPDELVQAIMNLV